MLIVNKTLFQRNHQRTARMAIIQRNNQKGTLYVVVNSILNGMDENVLSQKRIFKVRLFSGAMISDI